MEQREELAKLQLLVRSSANHEERKLIRVKQEVGQRKMTVDQ